MSVATNRTVKCFTSLLVLLAPQRSDPCRGSCMHGTRNILKSMSAWRMLAVRTRGCAQSQQRRSRAGHMQGGEAFACIRARHAGRIRVCVRVSASPKGTNWAGQLHRRRPQVGTTTGLHPRPVLPSSLLPSRPPTNTGENSHRHPWRLSDESMSDELTPCMPIRWSSSFGDATKQHGT